MAYQTECTSFARPGMQFYCTVVPVDSLSRSLALSLSCSVFYNTQFELILITLHIARRADRNYIENVGALELDLTGHPTCGLKNPIVCVCVCLCVASDSIVLDFYYGFQQTDPSSDLGKQQIRRT